VVLPDSFRFILKAE